MCFYEPDREERLGVTTITPSNQSHKAGPHEAKHDYDFTVTHVHIHRVWSPWKKSSGRGLSAHPNPGCCWRVILNTSCGRVNQDKSMTLQGVMHHIVLPLEEDKAKLQDAQIKLPTGLSVNLNWVCWRLSASHSEPGKSRMAYTETSSSCCCRSASRNHLNRLNSRRVLYFAWYLGHWRFSQARF